MIERIEIIEKEIKIETDMVMHASLITIHASDAKAGQLKSQILQDYTFAERCRRDGILTYSRECEDNKKIVNHLKEIIKILEIEIKTEEDNLKNIADGFKEMTYRMIDRMKSEKKVLEKLFEEKK